VKTEQFLVPLGTVIVIEGLEFQAGTSKLMPRQEIIVQQVFNSLEEITENTVGDTNSARVAEYKKMEFEILGYPDDSGDNGTKLALAQARANSVLNLMTYLGTPPWRLKATGIADQNRIVVNAGPQETKQYGRIEFIRRR
jgi:outer membrane protein OmpA-like peptidoglycan-associated protein